MKKLILVLIMIGFLCPAKGFSQGDSVQIYRKLNQLEQVTNETKVLLKKAETVAKQKQTLMQKLMMYINKLKADARDKQMIQNETENHAAIKEKNINGPVEEIKIPDGVDTIRGSFFYRLFHQNSYILRPYKIVNDEKIYLD